MTTSKRLTLILAPVLALAVLLGVAGQARAAGHAPHQVILQFSPGASGVEKAALRRALGVEAAQGLGGQNLVVYRTSSDLSVNEAIAAAEKSGLVRIAEPNQILHTASEPNDPYFLAHDQWALMNSTYPGDDIGATRAWDVTTGDPSLVVAVIDSGITFDHPDLSPRIWTNTGEIPGNGIDDDGDGFVDDVHGWNFVNGNPEPADSFGHGTAMSGIIGAAGDNGVGMTGVDQNASIMPLQAADSTGSLTSSDVVAAINYAGHQGASIVNMSFAGDGSFGGALEAAIANYPDTLFVAAAGNHSGPAEYPCALPEANILCVAATNIDDSLASFSNYGSSAVDIGAPGVHILEPTIGGGYQYGQGTSEAAAITSGAAALLRSAKPGMTATEVRQRIMDTADPDPALTGKTITGGRLDIGNALDYTPPQTTIVAEPAADGNDATPSFSFTSNENMVSYECQLDGAGWSACTTPTTLGHLADGEHTFAVRATDRGLNTDPTPASYTFNIDTVAPQTEIVSGPSGTINSDSASFSFTSNESQVSFECSLDGGSWSDCPSGNQTYTELADGEHAFAVRAIDAAGNVDASPATGGWIADAHLPKSTIIDSPATTTNSTVAGFAFRASEQATFECELDGGGWQGCTSPITYPGLGEGSHTFSVRATDTAGNVETSPPRYVWTIDTTPPDTSITSGPAALSNATNVGFTFASEPGASFECSLDGAAFSPCPATGVTYFGIAEGNHVFSVRATDTAGNVDPTPASRAFAIDRTGPVVSLTSTPAPSGESTTATFDFAGEPGSRFECSLDGGAFTACVSGVAYTGLSVGSHAFAVRAADDLGNVGTSVGFGFLIAAKPGARPPEVPQPPSTAPAPAPVPVNSGAPRAPRTRLRGRPPHLTTHRTVVFKLGGGRSYRLRIDGGRWWKTKKARLALRLGPGRHVLRVEAMRGRLVDHSPIVYRFRIERRPERHRRHPRASGRGA